MAYDHGHDHHHHHHRAPDRYDRAFALGIGLNLVYVAAETVFGLLAGSLALLADAGHNLSDVLGLALAWGAAWLARRQPTPRRTYGLRRSSILAALANAMLLLVAIGAISAFAQLLMTTAYRTAEPTLLAPFEYSGIVWTTLLGALLWAEAPGGWDALGIAILVASGLYIWHREVTLGLKR